MKTIFTFFFLCIICLADTNPIIAPIDYPYSNAIEILNNYTQSNYYLKLTNGILTGELIKDYNLNRVSTYTTFKIPF